MDFHAVTDSSWMKLIEACELGNEIRLKDIIILRLYLTMLDQMQIVAIKEVPQFLTAVAKWFRGFSNLKTALDAEKKFNFKEETKIKIKTLLLDLQRQRNTGSELSLESIEGKQDENVRSIIETLTSVLFEAVQFAGILPNIMLEELTSEVKELRNIASAFEGIKNNLIDFRNLIR